MPILNLPYHTNPLGPFKGTPVSRAFCGDGRLDAGQILVPCHVGLEALQRVEVPKQPVRHQLGPHLAGEGALSECLVLPLGFYKRCARAYVSNIHIYIYIYRHRYTFGIIEIHNKTTAGTFGVPS